jgi:undecaprenyl diphosphate synthase
MPTLPPHDPQQLLGIPPTALPRHIAVIMDGNGRWARQRGQERLFGHFEGVKSAKQIVIECTRFGIQALTLYSFSLENWRRPKDEVDGLMTLCAAQLAAERETFMANDVRLRHVGRRQELPPEVLHELDDCAAATAGNRGLTLCLALNYGGRAEIVDAVRGLAARVAAGGLDPAAIDDRLISDSLYTAGLPDPDLLIRTAGEMRISNFLLWQISYAELYVTDVFWPDFRAPQLYDALRAYAGRERRFGDVHASGGRPAGEVTSPSTHP